MEKEYFYLKGNTKVGPFTLDALKKEAITPDTSVHYSGLPDWVPARTLPELQALFTAPANEESSYNRREPNYNTSASHSASPQSTPPAQTAFESAGNSSSSTSYNPNSQRPPMPDSYLVWGILVTICCCLPFGIVSIVNATKVSSAYAAGDYVGAEKASKDAKKFAIWGIAGGAIFIVLYLLFFVVLAAVGMMD